MSKPKASIASDMLTAGGVEKSYKKIPAEQGRTIHKLYAGDSVWHGANLKYLATTLNCQIDDNLRLKGGANKKTRDLKIKTFISNSEFLNGHLAFLSIIEL